MGSDSIPANFPFCPPLTDLPFPVLAGLFTARFFRRGEPGGERPPSESVALYYRFSSEVGSSIHERNAPSELSDKASVMTMN